jgi:hypothetical protein
MSSVQTEQKVLLPPDPIDECQGIDCPASARVRVEVATGTLDFCGHHFHQFLGIPKFAAAMIRFAEREPQS